MSVIQHIKNAQAELAIALAEAEGAVPPSPPPPLPPALKGVCTGYWGPQEAVDLASLKPEVVRLEQPTSLTPWLPYKVIYLQAGDHTGNYNKGGIAAIDVPAFVAVIAKAVYANPNPGLYAVEPINEPAGEWFWGPNANTPQNAAAYAALIRAVWEASKTWSLKAPLLLASCDGGRAAPQWLEWMMAADPKILECFDLPTAHVYGGTGARTGSAEGNRAAVRKVHALTGKQVAVTEVGWPTLKATGDSLQWTEAQQAANITGFLQWAKASKEVALTCIYNYRDGANDPGYGLAHPTNGAYKPAWQAFQNA